MRPVIRNIARFKRSKCSRVCIHANYNTNKSKNPCSSHPLSPATLNVPKMTLLYLFLFLWFTFSSECSIHYCHNWQRMSGTVNNDKMVSNNSSTLATSIMATCFSTTEAIHSAGCMFESNLLWYMSHCIRATNIQSGIWLILNLVYIFRLFWVN